jgi:hypothetical protein
MKCDMGLRRPLTGRNMRAHFTGTLRTAWKLRIEKNAKRVALRRRPPEHQTRSSGAVTFRRIGHIVGNPY